MKNTKILLLILMTLNVSILTGCWNYREIEDVTMVLGAAIDKEKDKYIVTIESIKPQPEEQLKMVANIISQEGITIFDAIRSLILKTGKRLYWPHAKVWIVSEEIAKEGVVPVLDFITRDAEARSDIWLVVSKEKTAKELFHGKSAGHDTISAYIDDAFNSEDNISKYHGTELWQFLNDLSAKGISGTIPTATSVKRNGEMIPKVSGTAVFKKDKMVGLLDEIETRNMLFIKNELKGGLVVVHDIEKTDATLEIIKSDTKIKPILEGDHLIMKIDVKTEVEIVEITGKSDLISKKGREKLQKKGEETIKKQIQQVIQKCQKEYESDIFGFGGVVERKMPDRWKNIKEDWTQIYKNLDTQINVEIDIKGSALKSKPIKVSE